eukprot:Em0003g787a
MKRVFLDTGHKHTFKRPVDALHKPIGLWVKPTVRIEQLFYYGSFLCDEQAQNCTPDGVTANWLVAPLAR